MVWIKLIYMDDDANEVLYVDNTNRNTIMYSDYKLSMFRIT
jgi:hypothetical protein